MSKKLTKKTITFTPAGSTNKVNIFVVPYTNEKNSKLRGFANISILSAENKMLKQFNSLSVIEGKEGNLFLSEPQQKAYKNKDGDITSNPYYLMDRDMKDDLSKRIEAEATE